MLHNGLMYISACACHKWNDASQIIKITRNRGQDQNLRDTEPSNRESIMSCTKKIIGPTVQK